MELKWTLIAVVTIMGMMFVGMAMEQHEQSQCRIEALRALVKPELIEQVCK